MKRLLMVLALAWAACLLAASAARADGLDLNPYGKPDQGEHHDYVNLVTLKVEPEHGSTVSGTFRLTCYSDDKDPIVLNLKGLPRHAVFTVWFTSSLRPTAQRAGLGVAPYTFKTGGGDGHLYAAHTDFCPLSSYRWLEIRMHPDGDPTHLDTSVRVARVPLRGQQ